MLLFDVVEYVVAAFAVLLLMMFEPFLVSVDVLLILRRAVFS